MCAASCKIDFNEKKGFICDMDGVIYHGNRILQLRDRMGKAAKVKEKV